MADFYALSNIFLDAYLTIICQTAFHLKFSVILAHTHPNF